jgi:sugar phosphate isomerase/epimerase
MDRTVSSRSCTGSMSRRAAMATGLASLLAGGVASGRKPARQPLFGQGGHPLGISLYMLGDFYAKDLNGALDAVAGIGFREVETDIDAHPADSLRRSLERNNLRCPNVLVLPMPLAGRMGLQTDPGRLAESAHAIGAEYLTCTLFPLPPEEPGQAPADEPPSRMLARAFARLDADHWHRTADYLNLRGAEFRRHGLKFAYHNHNAEFARYGDTDGMTILLQNTDPSLVWFEMDAGWVAAAGRDPVELLNAYRGRFRLMHVKDLAQGHTPNTVMRAVTPEVGAGVLDWKLILPAAIAAGVRHFAVEQEPPYTIPPIEAARKSYAYLSTLPKI